MLGSSNTKQMFSFGLSSQSELSDVGWKLLIAEDRRLILKKSSPDLCFSSLIGPFIQYC